MEIREERHDGQKIWDDTNEAKIKVLVKDLEETDHRLIIRTKNTGSWLTVQGNTVTGTLLAATGFSDFLCASYYIIPPNLHRKYYS